MTMIRKIVNVYLKYSRWLVYKIKGKKAVLNIKVNSCEDFPQLDGGSNMALDLDSHSYWIMYWHAKATKEEWINEELKEFIPLTVDESEDAAILAMYVGHLLTEAVEAVMNKDSKGKTQVSLVPYTAIQKIAKVREFGNKKYGHTDSWMQVDPVDFYEAALRHLHKTMDSLKYDIGSEIDEESGLPHAWHALCSLVLAEGIPQLERRSEEQTIIEECESAGDID